MSVPGSNVRSGSPSLPRPLSPERTPSDASVDDDQLRRRGLGQHVGAGVLGAALLVAGERGDRDHLGAVVAKRRRRRDPQLGPRARQQVDRFLGDLPEREPLGAPLLAAQLGKQLRQRRGRITAPDRLCPPHALGLLDHRDRHLAEALARLRILGQQREQPVRAGEPGGAAADDRDADLDPLVLSVELAPDQLAPSSRSAADKRPDSTRAARGRPQPSRRACSAAVSFGRILLRSPTIPRSANSKIGALASLLIATMFSEDCMPTLCWIAPEMPAAR